ncbi:hypothetical protein, partial [Neisseria meningitidis]|uniref:hypothetical protein n=1 Tax=Neisseria meningitidis TaxID=487 RepID=UPI000FF58EDE
LSSASIVRCVSFVSETYIILHRNEKSGKAKNPPPSFPRKRESRILMPQEFIKDGRGLKVWIPACAGI